MRGKVAGLLVAAIVLLTACSQGDGPTPSPSPHRSFTVATTTAPTQLDPAVSDSSIDHGYQVNIFQTLLRANPGESAAKPDAAKDCRFDSALVMTCTLQPEMTFHNGHALTSSDVKFSVLRAIRLDWTGQRTYLLRALHRIETPTDLTVKFYLSEVDNEFWMGLASPAAAIVDEETYDADRAQPADRPVVGSGPYRVTGRERSQLKLAPFDAYKGPRGPAMESADVVIRYFADSGSMEQAMADHTVDAVWNGLSSAAATRLRQQSDANEGKTEAGFVAQTKERARQVRLLWSDDAPARNDDVVRSAVRDALQDDRIAESLLPPAVDGYARAFAAGGVPHGKPPRLPRTRLSIGFDPRLADQRDTASRIRDRLEAVGGLSVRLVDVTTERSDLVLSVYQAPLTTSTAWLQAYLWQPSAQSAVVVGMLVDSYRTASDPDIATVARLQQFAAQDALVVPMANVDQVIYTGPGFGHHEDAYGPGWQLGLWGFYR